MRRTPEGICFYEQIAYNGEDKAPHPCKYKNKALTIAIGQRFCSFGEHKNDSYPPTAESVIGGIGHEEDLGNQPYDEDAYKDGKLLGLDAYSENTRLRLAEGVLDMNQKLLDCNLLFELYNDKVAEVPSRLQVPIGSIMKIDLEGMAKQLFMCLNKNEPIDLGSTVIAPEAAIATNITGYLDKSPAQLIGK